MTDRPALRALAERVGILPQFTDITGRVRFASDGVRRRVLNAMGMDASTEKAARETLQEIDRAAAARLVDPVQVVVSRDVARTAIRVPAGLGGDPIRWRISVLDEHGEQVATLEGVSRGPRARRTLAQAFPVPEPGYYRLRVELGGGGREAIGEQLLVCAPARCTSVPERCGTGRRFGILANLYSAHGEGSWGIGDFGDLRALVEWSGDLGGAFVGVNPLHALRNEGPDVSPYAPVSRLHDNPIYLEIDRIPEVRDDPTVRHLAAASDVRDQIAALREAPRVPYGAVWELKRRILVAAHQAFRKDHFGRNTTRSRAFTAFLEARGEALHRFATFSAIAEREGPDWRRWPAALRDVGGAAVAQFRHEHPAEIGFYEWAQFELDRQLGEIGRIADHHLPLGLLTDLAIGCAPSGADPWSVPDLFVHHATIGAPPDDYAVDGQDWGLPPVDPRRLVESGFAFWIAVVRHAMRHAGALRLDHVMGLLRQYWIPAGSRSADGAYVRYPETALFAILAVESRRRRAVVIGEDLGTVPRGFAARLARWGVLSTRVLYFERGAAGFLPAGRYSRRALVTATTHDHPPLAGFWEGRDLGLRRAAGSISSDRALERAERERDRDRRSLVRRLQRDGTLDADGSAPDAESVVSAVYRFLARTRAPLVGVMLDDLAAEREPVNLPGVPFERFPSWTRKMRESLDDIRRSPWARSVFADLRRLRGAQ